VWKAHRYQGTSFPLFTQVPVFAQVLICVFWFSNSEIVVFSFFSSQRALKHHDGLHLSDDFLFRISAGGSSSLGGFSFLRLECFRPEFFLSSTKGLENKDAFPLNAAFMIGFPAKESSNQSGFANFSYSSNSRFPGRSLFTFPRVGGGRVPRRKRTGCFCSNPWAALFLRHGGFRHRFSEGISLFFEISSI